MILPCSLARSKDDDPTGMWLVHDLTARDYAEQLISEMKASEGHDPVSRWSSKGRHICFFTIINVFRDRRDVGDLLA